MERDLRAPQPVASRALRRAAERTAQVCGVRVTHPDRPMYPALGVTKEDLAHYYEAIAPHMLPHVGGRPLTLVRCPNGAHAPCSYMRHLHSWGPAALRRVSIREKTKTGEYLVADSPEALVALVQMDILEVHPWNSRVDALEQPDRLVFDLDPGPGVTWARTVGAAHGVRALLARVGLVSFAKTTGGKGVHVVVPLAPDAGWGDCLGFARTIAQGLEKLDPRTFTATMVKRARTGRIYVDYLRNHRAASAIAAYSTRARPEGTVAVPVSWDELTPALDTSAFTVRTVPARVAGASRDPWPDYGRVKQRLPSSARRGFA